MWSYEQEMKRQNEQDGGCVMQVVSAAIVIAAAYAFFSWGGGKNTWVVEAHVTGLPEDDPTAEARPLPSARINVDCSGADGLQQGLQGSVRRYFPLTTEADGRVEVTYEGRGLDTGCQMEVSREGYATEHFSSDRYCQSTHQEFDATGVGGGEVIHTDLCDELELDVRLEPPGHQEGDAP